MLGQECTNVAIPLVFPAFIILTAAGLCDIQTQEPPSEFIKQGKL